MCNYQMIKKIIYNIKNCAATGATVYDSRIDGSSYLLDMYLEKFKDDVEIALLEAGEFLGRELKISRVETEDDNVLLKIVPQKNEFTDTLIRHSDLFVARLKNVDELDKSIYTTEILCQLFNDCDWIRENQKTILKSIADINREKVLAILSDLRKEFGGDVRLDFTKNNAGYYEVRVTLHDKLKNKK